MRRPPRTPPRASSSKASESPSAKRPNPLHLGRPRGPREVPLAAPHEAEDGRKWVFDRMRVGLPLEQIIDAAKDRNERNDKDDRTRITRIVPPLTRAQVMSYWADVRKVEGEQLEVDRETERAHQVMILRQELVSMKQQRPIPWSAITRHQRLLAEMTGTLQPIEVDVHVGVDVRVRSAVMAVVGDMTADEIQDLARQQLALEEGERH